MEVRGDGSGGIELMKLSVSRFSLRSLLGAIYIHEMGEDPDMDALKKKKVSSLFCTEGGVHEKIGQLK